MPALVCLSSYLIAGELVGAKLAVGREREGEGEGEGERGRGEREREGEGGWEGGRGRGGRGGRERENEGEGGMEGGRESNRVNAFHLECTVYHKTHAHTQHTWSPQFDSKPHPLAKSVVPMYFTTPKSAPLTNTFIPVSSVMLGREERERVEEESEV